MTGVVERAWGLMAPPPKQTVSEWADEHRFLSPESSAAPGRWRTSAAPYQRGIMDAVSDRRTHTVVWMSSAQVGKTEVLNNILAQRMHRNPGPMMAIQPTVDMAKAWSKDRLEPMIRDTPVLHNLVFSRRTASESGSNILHKAFPGGQLSIVGANSASQLASRPERDINADEVDRYPDNVGGEGDPLALARARSKTFHNRKHIITSTPTIAGQSRIEIEFSVSDQRYFFVPCPHCGEFQRLIWGQVKWDKDKPETAHYVCEHNGCGIEHRQKRAMMRKGEWRATKEAEVPGTAGFHISEIYSPWSTWENMARAFLKAKKKGPELLKVFVNTSLGELWHESENSLDPDEIASRAERYTQPPAKTRALVASVDVQDDRIEVYVKAWGDDKESWAVEWQPFWGDPGAPELWKRLDDFLLKEFQTEDGRSLSIQATAVDSGYLPSMVYKFCSPRWARRVYATKGSSDYRHPLVSQRPTRRKVDGIVCNLFATGPTEGKDQFYHNLAVKRHGPRYQHYPQTFDLEFFEQLTAEVKKPKIVRGRVVMQYEPIRKRNEALDLEVLQLAALELAGIDLRPQVEEPEPPRVTQDNYTDMVRRTRKRK